MPQTVYNKVTDAEGNVTFVEVEVPTQEELDAANAAKAKANKEAMERRHELERLKPAAPKVVDAAEPVEAPSTPAQPAPVVATPALNEDEIVAKAVQQIEAKRVAAESEEAAVTAILKKHALPATYANVIRNSKNPEETAELIGRDRLSFAPATAGRAPTSDDVLSEAVKAFRSIGLTHPDDPANRQ